ncbi:MAG: FHA domain-containing protein [Planctomycetota bacterium]
METQVIAESLELAPSLEHYPEDGGPAVKTLLDAFPFIIGRDESSDLQINSGRVSRRHAVIRREDDEFVVSDQGSTNGTFLNGLRITESRLQTGDILALGDVEFTFDAGRADTPQQMATEVITFPAAHGGEAAGRRIVYHVRRMHEMLLHRSLPVTLEPISRLDGEEVVGFGLHEDESSGAQAVDEFERRLMQIECRVTGRLRQMRRLIAAEEAADAFGRGVLLLPIDSSEMGADGLADSLLRLREAAGEEKQLVIAVPADAVSDTDYFRGFCAQLREGGLGLAYDRFTGGQLPAASREATRPDYLRLARSLIRGVVRTPQRRQQVESALRQLRAAECPVIATAVATQEEADCCRQLGCQLAQGPLFGEAASAWSLRHRGESKAV